jgi:putative transcriptional regulator
MLFVKGELPASISCAVSIHLTHCPECRRDIAQLTENEACKSFLNTESYIVHDDSELDAELALLLDDMTDKLDVVDEQASLYQADNQAKPLLVNRSIKLKDKTFLLPSALNQVSLSNWIHLGKVSRCNIEFDEGEIKSHLLYMAPGTQVPKHTHKGFELTLILEGEYQDNMGIYQKGDLILLDQSHEHSPYTENGCLCITIANDALKFTQGLGKLLNPIGQYIY